MSGHRRSAEAGERARLVNEPPAPPPASAGDRRVVVLVCDSLGIGGAPDAEEYGDAGADTLAHVAEAVGGLALPLLERWGLGCLTAVAGVAPVDPPAGVVARLTETAAGKDSVAGHWELMGYRMERAFPTYPEGFPPDVIEPFTRAIGRDVLGNRPASGTVIIEELGEEHLATGKPIVYTSGDSVFQVAVHLDVVPLERLYQWCETAREILTGDHAVGRVIARPFVGEPGAFRRTGDRRDWALPPPEPTACDVLHEAGVPVKGVGKIEDLFAERGITWSDHASDNDESMRAVERFLDEPGAALVFANLVDFDQLYGHRNDPAGYAEALESFDRRLREIVSRLRTGDRVLVTGDHGTDPTGESTDHTRERVPMVAWGPDLESGADLGIRDTMADIGATVLELFGVPGDLPAGGSSFAGYL